MGISYEKYRIRVWNGPRGELPGPGSSKRAQDFYFQPYLLGPDENSPVRLALLWEGDMSTGQLIGLWLVCPRSADDPSLVHWRVALPVRAQVSAADSVAESASDDGGDLALTLRDDVDAAVEGW